VPERIATFDNDGTLWSEQPMYFQAFFIFDRIKALAPEHPEWKDKEPFASVLKGDTKAALVRDIPPDGSRPARESSAAVPDPALTACLAAAAAAATADASDFNAESTSGPSSAWFS
jgi:hypothetical protein